MKTTDIEKLITETRAQNDCLKKTSNDTYMQAKIDTVICSDLNLFDVAALVASLVDVDGLYHAGIVDCAGRVKYDN